MANGTQFFKSPINKQQAIEIAQGLGGGGGGGRNLGNWNATTNTPTLPNPPTAPEYESGDYYSVSVAGTQFGIDFLVGERIVVAPDGENLQWNKQSAAEIQSITGNLVNDTDPSNPVISLTATNTGAFTNSLTAKSTPVDADMFNLMDSAASNSNKKFSWANLKSNLLTYFNTLFLPKSSYITIQDFGGVGDMITDNYNAIISAAQSGKTVYFPAGNYVVNLDNSSSVINFAPNTRFVGDGIGQVVEGSGGVNIAFVLNRTSQMDIFNFQLNNSIENISFYIGGSVNNIIINLFIIKTFKNCYLSKIYFDGGIDDQVIEPENVLYQPNFSLCSNSVDDVADGLTISDCEIRNFNWLMLKTNNSLSTQNNFRFSRVNFINMHRPATINTPSGVANYFTFENCKYLNNFSSNSGFRHLGGTAGGKNFSFINNYFKSSQEANDLLHFEETLNTVVVGNIFDDVIGGGIGLYNNSASGVDKTCQNIVINDNIIVGSDGNKNLPSSARTEGIHLTIKSLTIQPATESCIVQNNIIQNFNNGLRGGIDINNLILSSNLIENCDEAIAIKEARQSIQNNLINNCPKGILSLTGGGGIVGENIFSNCENPYSSSDSYIIVNSGFGFQQKNILIDPSTTILIPVCELRTQTRLEAFILISALVANNQNRVKKFEVSYDNSSGLSVLELLQIGVGNIQINNPVLDNGLLKISIRNTGASQARVYVDIKFQDTSYIN